MAVLGQPGLHEPTRTRQQVVRGHRRSHRTALERRMSLMPTLFISHGAPTFALAPGLLGPRLTALGETLPRPSAVLIVSPHWRTRELQTAATKAPATIHDFGAFDD